MSTGSRLPPNSPPKWNAMLQPPAPSLLCRPPCTCCLPGTAAHRDLLSSLCMKGRNTCTDGQAKITKLQRAGLCSCLPSPGHHWSRPTEWWDSTPTAAAQSKSFGVPSWQTQEDWVACLQQVLQEGTCYTLAHACQLFSTQLAQHAMPGHALTRPAAAQRPPLQVRAPPPRLPALRPPPPQLPALPAPREEQWHPGSLGAA